MRKFTTNLRQAAVTLTMGLASASVLASGPLNLNPNDPDGVERWPNGGANIPFNVDQGGIPGVMDKATIVAAFAAWEGVSTSTATYSDNGDLPFDVDVTNYAPFVQNLFFGTNISDGLSPVVFDDDGSIFVDLFGVSGVLGFASTDTRDANGTPIEAVCFLNGGATVSGGGTYPDADFLGVQVHEFGHYSGLGHTVVNGQNVGLGDTSGPTPFNTYGDSPPDQVETMYPFALVGGGQVTPHADDIGFYSFLYPSASYFADSGTISGTIFASNGTTPLTGVNVIARNVADPFVDAVSAISGDRGDTGVYTINGLTPGAQYTVHTDQILQGGFSTTPIGLPGPEEFYNGANESNNITSPDDPQESVNITTAAGAPNTGIDVIFNAPGPGDPLPVGDDGFVQLALPFEFRICGQPFDAVFVNANGNVTFGAGNSDFSESSAEFLAGPPRIAGVWDDLNPTGGGIVTYFPGDREFRISYQNVPEFPATGANSFDIVLRQGNNGAIGRAARGNRFEIQYGDLTVADGLSGVSCGGAVASGFEEGSDLTALDQPIETGQTGAVYELFLPPDSPNDLANETLVFKATKGFFDQFEPNNSAQKARQVKLPFDTIDRYSDINPTGNDVDWYRFEAEADTTIFAEVLTGQLDTVLGLYKLGNGKATPVQLAFDDDGGNGVLSKIIFPIAESGRYAIAVSTFPDADFTGDGGDGGRYVLSAQAIEGTLLDLGDDDFEEVPLEFSFPYQGDSWNSVFVNSNGNLTFGAGSTDFSESVADFLSGPPRIAGVWDDLSPNNGGLIIVDSDSTSLSVSFVDVPEFISTGANTFTFNLDASGDVTVTYGAISATDGLAGVTEGNGAADPGPTDLSAAPSLSAAGTTYEQFDGGNPNDLELEVLEYISP